MTHSTDLEMNAALEADAAKLEAMGQDPGPTIEDLGRSTPTETSRLVDELREPWERIPGAAARKINRILRERKRAADLLTSKEAEIETLRRERDDARDGESRWLLRFQDIREASGLGVRPMLDELAGAIRDLLASKELENEKLKAERDAWKDTANHHFGHMRAALDLSYALQYPVSPELLDQVADEIDCGGTCDTAWREWDTNATGCTKSDTSDGCAFEKAANLRDFAKALRIQAWTLAFSPMRGERP